MRWWRRYFTILIFAGSVVLALLLAQRGIFTRATAHIGAFGYVAALGAGMLFASTPTAASAAVVFVDLGKQLHPLLLAILGGVGAACGDLLFYSTFKKSFLFETKTLLKKILSVQSVDALKAALKKKHFRFFLAILAATLIASPLPDELGLALLSIIDFKPKYLSIIGFVLNGFGIFILASVGRLMMR